MSFPFAAGAGESDSPVIFWAHYMPMMPRGELHANHHIGGNADVFPFLSQAGTLKEHYAEDLRHAMESGINGFQFLVNVPDAAYLAAAEFEKETGKRFYITPEWCALGENTEKACAKIAAFITKYRDNPHIPRQNGRQIHFLYGQQKWLGAGNVFDAPGLPAAQRRILELCGETPLMIQTIDSIAATLLDRPELRYRALPAFEQLKPGEVRYIAETNWDGVTGLNSGANIRREDAERILQRAAERPGFLFVPSIRTMYDSSNRSFQAILCRGQGIRVLRNDLRMWVALGSRQFTFSTWNDVNETMLLPSSRNVWGANEIIRFYHDLAATGRSTFAEPKFVVSYPPEALLGDQLFFQCLLLPERDCRSNDFAVNVEFRNLAGQVACRGGFLLNGNGGTADDLGEFRIDTSDFPVEDMVLQPYVSIRRIDKTSGESRQIYNKLRLAPMRIRANKLHYFNPYSIALDHVVNAPDFELARLEGPGARFERLACEIPGAYTRVTLQESSLPRGAFRAEDKATGTDRYYLRLLAVGAEISATLSVKDGTILDSSFNHWNLDRAFETVAAKSAPVRIPAAKMPLVVRIDGTFEAEATLQIGDLPPLALRLRELADNPLTLPLSIGGKECFLQVHLTLDATDPNLMFPVTAGRYTRLIPMNRGFEGERVFHAWALAGDKIAYTKPILLKDPERKGEMRLEFIRSYGVFDDFINDSSPHSQNPFTMENLCVRTLPAAMIPHYRLDFTEGGGRFAGFNGTAQQLGFANVDPAADWKSEKGALIPGAKGLFLRPKSWPHGSFTAIMEIKIDPARQENQLLLGDGENWQGYSGTPYSLGIDAENHLVARRQLAGDRAVIRSAAPLAPGWHKVALRFDLRSLSLYLDGKKVGDAQLQTPSLQRTHSVPKIGAPFYGAIRSLEIFGAALDENNL